MGYFDEEKFDAIINPSGFSGHTSPDGTPLTNSEYYRNKVSRRNDFH